MRLRAIPGFPGYSVTDTGIVVRPDGTAAPTNRAGSRRMYERVSMGPKSAFVHAVVLSAFVGRRPMGRVARHLDGNPRNNHLNNLAWGTHKENARDRDIHGRTARGKKNGQTKLTAEIVRGLRQRYSEGHTTHKRLAEEIGVARATVRRALSGETWGWV